MNCWHCRRTAVGVCRFCGRALCENDVKTHPFIVSVFSGAETARALVVEDALFCGDCRPRPDPVELPSLS